MGAPGVKEKELDNHAAKSPDADSSVIGRAECDKALDVNALDYDHVNSLKTPIVKFNLGCIEQIDVVPYSNHYPLHPSKIVVSKLTYMR